MEQQLEGAWAALLAQLPVGPERLASHPSAEPLLSVSLRGMGTRPSDAVARTAVSLAFLRAFRKLVLAQLGPRVTTKEVVERLVKPLAAKQFCLASRLPAAAVGVPTAFISHAWGTCHYGVTQPACGCASDAGSFALLVDSVSDFFAGAVDTEVFVWLDIFAVNQHDASGSELDGGKTLRKTVDLAAHTLVVLERGSTLTLSRLWCLYEVGTTPPEKLQLLTRGFAPAELTAKFKGINVETASCWDSEDRYFNRFIRGQIQEEHGTQELFEQKLKLRLLLRPTSYEADLKALLANSADAWRFEELQQFVQTGDGGLACIASGPGEGKSTIAAALCRSGWRSDLCAGNLVHAWHLCKASDVTRQDVGEIIRSLAYQLATARVDATTLRFPAFAHTLLQLDDAVLEQLGDHNTAFDELLKKPLLSLAAGTRVVLLFDALDEAESPLRPVSKALGLLLDLGRLGITLSVVVTTRPEPVILDALQARWKDRFRSFLPGMLRSAGSDAPGQSKLRCLLQSKIGGATAIETVDDIYNRFFDAVPTVDRQLIDILLAAREPPSLMLLKELGVRGALEQLPGWGVLFYERDFCVHMLHKSLAEWLLEPGRSGVNTADVARGHAAWATLLSAQLSAWLDSSGRAPVSGHYIYRNVLAHLDECGRGDESRRLLMRLPWLQAMLRERGVFELIREVAARSVSGDGTLDVLRRTLVLSVPGLQGAGADVALLSQLVGRLGFLGESSAEMAQLVADARAWRGPVSWMCPVARGMREPVGALEAILVGHTGCVTAVAVLRVRFVVSGSDDKTVRIWNAATGECERVMEGHTDMVQSVAVLGDWRVVSGSRDKTLRIWNAATGECERVLKGHTDWVTAVAVLGDGVLVSGSRDTTLRIWTAASGECKRVLRGHAKDVSAVAVLSDGRVVSSSWDTTLHIWNTASGSCERVLKGHTIDVSSVAVVLGDRRVVSGSWDKTARIWNVATGECECVLKGHTKNVQSLAVLGDGRVVSGSHDSTLRIWDAATGECERVLEGHTNDVSSVAVLGDGRVISASADKTLCIWNAVAEMNTAGLRERVLDGHKARVRTVIALGDGRVVSGSNDNSLRIWNATSGTCERVLEGHTDVVNKVALLGDGRVVSCSWDKTLRIWNVATGECECVMTGHTSHVKSVAVLGNGRVVSSSWDNTLRIWKVPTALTAIERISALHCEVCERVLPADSAEALNLIEELSRSSSSLSGDDLHWRAARVFNCQLPFLDEAGNINWCRSEIPGSGWVVAVAAGKTMHFLKPVPAAFDP